MGIAAALLISLIGYLASNWTSLLRSILSSHPPPHKVMPNGTTPAAWLEKLRPDGYFLISVSYNPNDGSWMAEASVQPDVEDQVFLKGPDRGGVPNNALENYANQGFKIQMAFQNQYDGRRYYLLRKPRNSSR